MRVTAEKGVPLAEAAERCRLALRRAEEAVVGKSEVLERVLGGFSPRGTCFSKTSPGWGRRWSPGPSPESWGSPSGGSSSSRTSSRRTSPAG
jgi:hypothetical protein